MRPNGVQGLLALIAVVCTAASAVAQDGAPSQDAPAQPAGLVELHFTPVPRAQLAIWIERQSGEFLSTVRLTEAVAYRGIGNRPGASEMNSGFRWPYGRREGALPIWARRRASVPGAQLFRRVIFQNRTSEGDASRSGTTKDYSPDDYYCLSFNRARSSKDALDAVSCASVFSSDKGRFITQDDIDHGYAEPYEPPHSSQDTMRALSLYSLYPPRRDLQPCSGGGCFDHPDVALYASHAREVMPDIDAVTMATPAGDAPQQVLFPVPESWGPGGYRACVEINVEGDYNVAYNDSSYPTPALGSSCDPKDGWDYYALCFGYPYRGQPSVAYCADFEIGGDVERVFSTDSATGSAGGWDVQDASYGQMQPMNDMTDDPVGAPGSGADRLEQSAEGWRLQLVVRPAAACLQDTPPSAVSELRADNYPDELEADQRAHVSFHAASHAQGIYRYDVRVATTPITDEASFMAAMPAKQATTEAAELIVPTDAAAGAPVAFDMGGLVQQTHYYVAVRAMDACARFGPIASAELTTKRRVFATVSPCFVATAAYGSPLAREIGALRRLRDRHLLTNTPGRALVAAYYGVGPTLASAIRERPALRAAVRALLSPLVALAGRLDE